MKHYITMTENECYVETPITDGITTVGYKKQLVMTKDAFISCYNKWIKGDAEKGSCDRNICTQNEYNGIGCDECIYNPTESEDD